ARIDSISLASSALVFCSTAVGHDRFNLAEVSRGIPCQAAGITNGGEYAGTRCGIADGRVPVLIDGYAGHPAEQSVAAVIPSLLLNWRGGKYATGDVKLIPANSHWTAAARVGIDRVIRPQRFGATGILVYDWSHYFVPQCVELLF